METGSGTQKKKKNQDAVIKKWTLEFIEEYKKLPSLWDTTATIYHNRTQKKDDYNIFIQKLREIETNASQEDVKKKINSLRAAHRKELNKVKESQKSGNGVDDVYIPTLYYYDEMDFLKDQETVREGLSNIDADPAHDENQSTSSAPPPYTPRLSGPSKIGVTKKRKLSPEDEALTLITNRLKNPDSKSTNAARHWADELDTIEESQQIFVKKIINEALFEGKLGTLTKKSKLVVDLDEELMQFCVVPQNPSV